jgi:bacterioferritin-associated ferredoxin
MPGEIIDPKNTYDFEHRFASALKSLRTVCQLSWKCPRCGARNESNFDGARLRKTYGTAIEARCGKCHGQKVTLLDSKSRTMRPDELLLRK